jgi:hypothetical protein
MSEMANLGKAFNTRKCLSNKYWGIHLHKNVKPRDCVTNPASL